MPLYRDISRSYESSSRSALLPKPIGRKDAAAVSLGFERYQGFYELAGARLRPPHLAVEHVSRDFGHLTASRTSSRPPARQERKRALLVFFLMLPNATHQSESLIEVARGGLHSWCHSLYRLTVHHPKEGGGNKWLAEFFGLENEESEDPFSGVLRFIQCRRVGETFIVHLDGALFDPTAVSVSVWERGMWCQSSHYRSEILYDLIRQVPRWTPLEGKLREPRIGSTSNREVPLRGPWEDMPLYFRYLTAARKVQLVGLNHQVFRRARIDWINEQGAERINLNNIASYLPGEGPAEAERRIAIEVDSQGITEPFSNDLEELTVFIGSPVAHAMWRRNTGWQPEGYLSAENFWKQYLGKIARLRPGAKIRLQTIDDVSPLVLHLAFPDGSAFLKWTPAMFGAYHPGNPGWNLLWNLGAPPPPHFAEILLAMSALSNRAEVLSF